MIPVFSTPVCLADSQPDKLHPLPLRSTTTLIHPKLCILEAACSSFTCINCYQHTCIQSIVRVTIPPPDAWGDIMRSHKSRCCTSLLNKKFLPIRHNKLILLNRFDITHSHRKSPKSFLLCLIEAWSLHGVQIQLLDEMSQVGEVISHSPALTYSHSSFEGKVKQREVDCRLPWILYSSQSSLNHWDERNITHRSKDKSALYDPYLQNLPTSCIALPLRNITQFIPIILETAWSSSFTCINC